MGEREQQCCHSKVFWAGWGGRVCYHVKVRHNRLNLSAGTIRPTLSLFVYEQVVCQCWWGTRPQKWRRGRVCEPVKVRHNRHTLSAGTDCFTLSLPFYKQVACQCGGGPHRCVYAPLRPYTYSPWTQKIPYVKNSLSDEIFRPSLLIF